MKINGLKNLNSNWYDSIMIRNINNNIKVDVKNKVDISKINCKNKFYNRIKKLSLKERVSEIIRYYLNNNKIYSLEQDILGKYSGTFINIRGTRNMYLKLNKDNVEPSIVGEILNKYILDRNKLMDLEIKNIEIYFSNKGTSYNIYNEEFNYKNEDVLSFRLIKCNDKLLSFEKDFFNNFIKNKVESVDEKISFEYKNGLPQFL